MKLVKINNNASKKSYVYIEEIIALFDFFLNWSKNIFEENKNLLDFKKWHLNQRNFSLII